MKSSARSASSTRPWTPGPPRCAKDRLVRGGGLAEGDDHPHARALAQRLDDVRRPRRPACARAAAASRARHQRHHRPSGHHGLAAQNTTCGLDAQFLGPGARARRRRCWRKSPWNFRLCRFRVVVHRSPDLGAIVVGDEVGGIVAGPARRDLQAVADQEVAGLGVEAVGVERGRGLRRPMPREVFGEEEEAAGT